MEDPKPSADERTVDDTAAPGRRWEYEVATVIGGSEDLRAELNSAGAKGWELVTCESRGVQREMWVVVLKRAAGEQVG